MAVPQTRLGTSGQSLACLLCRWRGFSTTSWRSKIDPAKQEKQGSQATTQDEATRPSAPTSPFGDAPRSYGRRADEKFTPKPLARPIGMQNPPRPGENTGVDQRSLRKRRDDFVDYDKHLIRRKELTEQISRPYFRDWSNLQFHRGKSFLPPPRLFRGDKSLYFPNLVGWTLSKADRKLRDTTPTLAGKVSVVSVFSSVWGERQAATFTSREANPTLHEALARHAAGAAQPQLVLVNIEENRLRHWLIRLFVGNIRRKVAKENWEHYFVVRKGVSSEIRERIGLLNSKVAYTYLVDGDCRIRWAGSGDSLPEEREGLVKGLQRLVDEMCNLGEAEEVNSKGPESSPASASRMSL